MRTDYGRTFIALLGIVVFVSLASLGMGSQWMSPIALSSSLLGYGNETQQMIVWSFRMPRVLLVLLVGWGIAISGVMMQGVLRNDLAEPGILGVTTGGNLGITLALSLFGIQIASPWTLPAMSMAGGLCVVLAVCGLAIDRGGIYPARLLLTGVAVSAAVGAFTLVLSLNVDRQIYSQALAWATGSFNKADWNYVLALAAWLGLLMPVVMAICPVLNILRLRDENVISLGVSVFHWRLLLLVIAVALGSAAMAMSGGIVFLGLIAPHIARRLSGPQHGRLVPTTGLMGMLLLLIADTAGRTLLAPVEIPAGIMVGGVGGIYFVYQLMTTKG